MTASKLRELGFQELLNKPWTGRELGEAVARALTPPHPTEKQIAP